MRWRTMVFLAMAAGIAAGTATAETIHLRSGATVDGEVTEFTGEKVILVLAGAPTSRVELPVAVIAPYSLFQLKRAAMNPSSVKERIELAKWAQEHELHALAHEEYAAAKAISKEPLPEEAAKAMREAEERCGVDRLAQGKRLEEEGDLAGAREAYSVVVDRYSDCSAADEAKERLARVTDEMAARDERRAISEERAAAEADSKRKLDRVERLLDLGRRLRRVEYEALDDPGGHVQDLETAARVLREARREVARLTSDKLTERAQLELQALEFRVRQELVEVYVDLGYDRVYRGSLVQAGRYATLALSLDPNAPSALDLRRAIAEASGRTRAVTVPR